MIQSNGARKGPPQKPLAQRYPSSTPGLSVRVVHIRGYFSDPLLLPGNCGAFLILDLIRGRVGYPMMKEVRALSRCFLYGISFKHSHCWGLGRSFLSAFTLSL